MGAACRGVRILSPRVPFLFLGVVNEAGETPALPVKAAASRQCNEYIACKPLYSLGFDYFNATFTRSFTRISICYPQAVRFLIPQMWGI